MPVTPRPEGAARGSWEELAQVLGRQVQVLADPGARIAVLHQLAQLQLDKELASVDQVGAAQYADLHLPGDHQGQGHNILVAAQEALGAIDRVERPEALPAVRAAMIDPGRRDSLGEIVHMPERERSQAGGEGVVAAIIDIDKAIFGDTDMEFTSPWTTNDHFLRGYGRKLDYSPASTFRRKAYQLLWSFMYAYIWRVQYEDLNQYASAQQRGLAEMSDIRCLINIEGGK